MPFLKKILILTIIFFSMSPLYAQNVDTIGIARLENIFLMQPDTLEFDIRLLRSDDRWDRWANGTFMVNFADSVYQIDPNNIEIELIAGTTELPQRAFTGQLPTSSYYITPRTFSERLSITIAGPDDYNDAVFVPQDSGIKIGSFRVFSKNGQTIPADLNWLMPQDYYQACAFKMESDSIHPPNIPWGESNDNYEMHDFGQTTTVRYEKDDTTGPIMDLDYFHCEYAGTRKVLLRWQMSQEAYNRGFILKRGIVPLSTDDTTQVEYNHVAARWDGPTQMDQLLIGQGTTKRDEGPFVYIYAYDTVDYRGEEYCYLLQYQDFNNEIHDISYTDTLGNYHERAICCVPIPNAVITRAHPLENPFSESTTVEYDLDDDVILTVRVYNLEGRLMTTLIDQERIDRGVNHTVVFDAASLLAASQGLYDMVFIAQPIDDPNVEVSKAIVKLQLIR